LRRRLGILRVGCVLVKTIKLSLELLMVLPLLLLLLLVALLLILLSSLEKTLGFWHMYI
jgi:hypothetical protein